MSEHVETLPAVSAPADRLPLAGANGGPTQKEAPVRPSDIALWSRTLRELSTDQLKQTGAVDAAEKVIADLAESDSLRMRRAGAKLAVQLQEVKVKLAKVATEATMAEPGLAIAAGAGGSSIETVIRVVQEQRRIEHIPPAGQTGN